jgi:hypothetical protein
MSEKIYVEEKTPPPVTIDNHSSGKKLVEKCFFTFVVTWAEGQISKMLFTLVAGGYLGGGSD